MFSLVWFYILLHFVCKCVCLNWYRCRYICHYNKVFKNYFKGPMLKQDVPKLDESKPELFKGLHWFLSPKSITGGGDESIYFQMDGQVGVNREDDIDCIGKHVLRLCVVRILLIFFCYLCILP